MKIIKRRLRNRFRSKYNVPLPEKYNLIVEHNNKENTFKVTCPLKECHKTYRVCVNADNGIKCTDLDGHFTSVHPRDSSRIIIDSQCPEHVLKKRRNNSSKKKTSSKRPPNDEGDTEIGDVVVPNTMKKRKFKPAEGPSTSKELSKPESEYEYNYDDNNNFHYPKRKGHFDGVDEKQVNKHGIKFKAVVMVKKLAEIDYKTKVNNWRSANEILESVI